MKFWRQGLLADRGPLRVAFIGDSVLIAPPGRDSVATAAARHLRHRGGRWAHLTAHVLPIPGTAAASEYLLADELVRARPDRLVLELNLRTLGPMPPGILAPPELAGYVETARIPEAAFLPLSYAGVTLNRLLFYRLLVVGGYEKAWVDLIVRQGELFNLRSLVEPWLDERLGSNEYKARAMSSALVLLDRELVPGKRRSRKEGLLRLCSNALEGIDADHPRMRVFGALLEQFRRAGIRTLVWLPPLNVEHIRSVGIDPEGLHRTIAAAREVAEAHGALLVDLHDMLADDGFRDSGDHLTYEGEPNATELVGDRLAAAFVRAEAEFQRRSAQGRAP